MTMIRTRDVAARAALLLGAATLLSAAAVAQPANDECAGAVTIACGGNATTDNTAATTAGGDPTYACRVGGAGQGFGTIWFKFVATQATAVVDTEGSVVTDTLLQAFSGDCAGLTVIGCDDDGGTGLLSRIALAGLSTGSTYYLEAAAWGSATTRGNITVNVRCDTPPPPLTNDECTGAVAIACGASGSVDNTTATLNPNDPIFDCRGGTGPGQGDKSVWFKFVATQDSALLDTEGSAVGDTMLQVFSGTCESLTVIGCDDDGGTGLNSKLSVFGLSIGQTYYIEGAAYTTTTTTGLFKVNITCPAPPPPGDPINDNCTSPIIIGATPYNDSRTNDLATADGPPGSCNSASATTMQNSIWYKWTPSACAGSGTATLTIDGPDYDIIATVLTGDCELFTEVACGDEPEPVVITFGYTAGTTYTFQIGDWGVSEGGGPTLISLTTSGGSPCPGDADGNRVVNQDDIDIVLFNYGTNPAPGTNGDIDCDGDVDQDDIDNVLFYYGTSCP